MSTYCGYAKRVSTRDFGRPKCPRCGSMLLVAEQSAFSSAGRIRHTWSCDDCNHEFVTSIALWPR
jgi:transposase-like protein